MNRQQPGRTLFRRPVFAAFVVSTFLLTVTGLSGCADYSKSPGSEAAYRPIRETLQIRMNQGWTLVSAPTDGGRYRNCGAIEWNPRSGVASLEGSFAVGHRSIAYKIPVPDGKAVAVEGLDPLDGGPLMYAVLTRTLP